MTTPDDKQTLKRLEIGQALESFLGTAAGSHLIKCSADDMESAFAEFMEVDPTDPVKVAAIQMKARVADRALAYIRDAIMDGKIAGQEVEAERFTD